MLASIYIREVLTWNSHNFLTASGEEQTAATDANSENSETNRAHTPDLRDEIFRKIEDDASLVECF